MTWREFIRVLNRPPERAWPEGVLHHGARALLLVILAVGTVFLFPIAPLPDFPVVEKGMVPDQDVVAEIPFPVYRSEQELERARQDAAASINPIFVFDSTAVDSMLSGVNRFFARVDSVASSDQATATKRRRMRDLLAAYALQPLSEGSNGDVDLLMDPTERRLLQRTVRTAILDELPRGIATAAELEEAQSDQIRLMGHGRDRVVPRDSIRTSRDFYDRSLFYVPTTSPTGYEQLQRLLLVRFLVPSIQPDWEATQAARARNRAAVPLIKTEVLQGERVVAARERVTDEQVEKLKAYKAELERRGELGEDQRVRFARTTGVLLFSLITISLFGALLIYYRQRVYASMRQVSLLAFLMAAVVAIAAVLAFQEWPVTLIPIAFPALVVATLWDGRLALNLSLITAVLLSGQTPFLGIVPLFTLVAAGAVASLAVRVVRRRSQTWVFIALIAITYALVGIVLGLLRTWSLDEFGRFVGWGLVNAIASAFAALGFLPLFESFTGITTDQTLLELADANRPLLRRLSMEAPGTYAHSIAVANLAEAGADAIDAHALLVRVGVYYHDVGKIARPQFFIENQPSGRNPHDRLKPALSAQVIRNHVVEGVRLAEDEGLPACVKAFITEHHGTQNISFFLDQAREAEPDAELDPRDFAYPGPRPQSRETAVAMLADSVESAARVLPDPTPDSIRKLVERIVQAKIDAGQLDETPITIAELKTVKEQFVTVLTGMYHQRIDYPPRGQGPQNGESGAGSKAPASLAPGDPAPGSQAPPAPAPDGQPSGEPAPADSGPDGRAPDGRAPDGRAPDGRAPDGRAPDGVAPHDAVADERGPAGAARAGTSEDGAPAPGAPAR